MNISIVTPVTKIVEYSLLPRFWSNATKFATASSQRQFIDGFQMFMDAIVQQAVDRSTDHIRDIDSYLSVRRNTIGAMPAFALCGLYLDIPDSVIKHPVIAKLAVLSTDMIIMDNDLMSYKVE